MCQGFCKQYVNKENREFMVAIIDYELRDDTSDILYGIILCDDDKLEKKIYSTYKWIPNKKIFSTYKLKTLMTKEQMRNEYGINSHDLPKKLLLKRKIIKQDLN